MCEKGALWVEGSQPVSQEAASLPTLSSFEKKQTKKNLQPTKVELS